jgi:hypothetical protein
LGGLYLQVIATGWIQDDDVQEHFHAIAIKLLVEPGKLFRGWEPRRHGPLDRRFRRSVWNAIRNLVEKSQNRRKWMTAVDPTVMAGMYVGRPLHNNIIGEFRDLVFQRLGKLALAILDQRLAGRETKNLVGSPGFTAYSIKRDVQQIKELAHQFAQQIGDSGFLNLVNRAMDMESATVEKRKAALITK